MADKVIPPSWQWPVGGTVEALILKSGKKAIALKGAPRIQIYDATGEYLGGGWHIKNVWKTGAFKIVGTGEQTIGPLGAEMIMVQDPKRRIDTLFDLEGQILLEKNIDHAPIYYGPPRDDNFKRINLKTKWYFWPLYDKKNGISLAVIGAVGLFILDCVAKLFPPTMRCI